MTALEQAIQRGFDIPKPGKNPGCPLCLHEVERMGQISGEPIIGCLYCGWSLALVRAKMLMIRKQDPAAAEAQMKSDQ